MNEDLTWTHVLVALKNEEREEDKDTQFAQNYTPEAAAVQRLERLNFKM